MIDIPSAVLGGIALANVSGLFYAAYLKGARDATAPEEVVDLGEVGAYLKQDAAIDALQDDQNDSN